MDAAGLPQLLADTHLMLTHAAQPNVGTHTHTHTYTHTHLHTHKHTAVCSTRNLFHACLPVLPMPSVCAASELIPPPGSGYTHSVVPLRFTSLGQPAEPRQVYSSSDPASPFSTPLSLVNICATGSSKAPQVGSSWIQGTPGRFHLDPARRMSDLNLIQDDPG